MSSLDPNMYEKTNRSNLSERQDNPAESDTTATNSSDEFDWSENEEGTPKELTKAKRGRALWMAFLKLSKLLRVLVVGALVAGILLTPLLVVELCFRNSIVRDQVHMWSLWLSIVWAAGCATYLVVDALPPVLIWILVLVGLQVERLKVQVELFMAVSGWLKLVLDVAWGWVSLSVLRTVYHPPGPYWLIINRVMQAMFAASIILLVEKVFLQFVAITFHQKALADRLAENRLALKILDRLSNAQPLLARKSPYPRRGHKSPSASVDLLVSTPNPEADHGDTGLPPMEVAKGEKDSKHHRKRGHRQRKAKKAMASVIVDQVGGAIGAVALKDSKFSRGAQMSGLTSARRLARKLFAALNEVDPSRSHLIVEDFYPYFRSTSEAHDAFAIFDKDGNGDISKREMREAVQRIYKERKALVAGLKDVDSIVGKLDAVLLAVAIVCIIFVCLLIFNRSNTLTSLVPLATIILGFSFIFGHSAQTLFDSLIFIFSTHVFDVGDLVMIDDQALFVREFGLFSTTFRRIDGQEIIAPNSLLASTKLVHNLRRSKSMWETTTITIAYNTPLEKIEQLRLKILDYVNQNSREWSSTSLNIDKMEYQNSIWLVIGMEHRPNWQDWAGRWGRRTMFMRNLKVVLEELDIGYTMPVQPILLPKGDGDAQVRDMLGNAGYFSVPEAPSMSRVRSMR